MIGSFFCVLMGSVYAAMNKIYCRRVLSYKPNFAIVPNALIIVKYKKERPRRVSLK